MKLFAVFQEGVYRHRCYGIFDTQEAAEVRAKAVAEADSDDWHTYDVVPFTLNASDESEAAHVARYQKPPRMRK